MTLEKVNKRKRQRFDSEEERFYLGWDDGKTHFRKWIFRTAIFHFSNGTNQCRECGETRIDCLTFEHEDFNRSEINRLLGIYEEARGCSFAYAFILRGLYKDFPDVNITVKCMACNSKNKNPNQRRNASENHYRKQNRDHIDPDYEKRCTKCGEIKKSKDFPLKSKSKDGLQYMCSDCNNKRQRNQHNEYTKKAYAIYGYHGDPSGMTWGHTNNDGNVHRKYLAEKYGWKSGLTGSRFARLMIKEYEAGVPNYPGLIVQHENDNHIEMKQSYINNTAPDIIESEILEIPITIKERVIA